MNYYYIFINENMMKKDEDGKISKAFISCLSYEDEDDEKKGKRKIERGSKVWR